MADPISNILASSESIAAQGSTIEDAGQLYAEAAPRIRRILGQYDNSADFISWVEDNWPIVLAGIFMAGVAAGYLGTAIYHRQR
jgi:hypothetical protein